MFRKLLILIISLPLLSGFSSLLSQEKEPAQIHFTWQIRSQIKTSEFVFDFSQNRDFEIEKNILFAASGLEISPSEQSATLVAKQITVPIAEPEPFLAVVAVWKSDVSNKGEIKLSLRGSQDGKIWGDWQDVSINEHAVSQPGEHFSNLVFLEQETRFVQYSVILTKSQQGVSPILKNLRFVFSSPGKTPEEVLDKIKKQHEEKRLKKLPGQAYPKPPVTTRTAWGCPQGQSSPLWPPQYTTATHLIVHHTATSNVSEDWAAVVRSIWNYHTFTVGWGDVGYNFLIDPDGIIYEGRGGGNDVIGAHFSCANSNTMGVGVMGTFTSVSPTANALTNLNELLAWKSDDSTIDPLATAFHNPTELTLFSISGHRDANPSPSHSACPSGTVCPGANLYGQLPTIRNDVNNLLNTPLLFATFPYTTSFESGELDQFWTTSDGAGNGAVQVLESQNALSGSFLLTMTVDRAENVNRNEANLHLNLSGQSEVDLSFWWLYLNNAGHSSDGIYISDDGGSNFVQVFNLPGGDLTWRQVNLDIDQLARSNGLDLSATFVVKFQQYYDDRTPFANLAFDEISITNTATTKPPEAIAFGLEPNYPNPFNPKTTIRYKILNDGPVSLRIYNLQGQLVRTLIERDQANGHYAVQWGGIDDTGIPVSSGFYLYELRTRAFRQVKRMILLK